MERWFPVDQWPYEVSDMGRVRRSEPASGTRPGLVLKTSKSNTGYMRVQLSRDGTPRKFLVARLVAEAFVPRRRGAPFVNHKNGDKTDNRAENLEWVTRSENQLHAYDTGLQLSGEAAGRAKLTLEHVKEIVRRHAAGESQTALAKEYPVNQSMISKIVRGEYWPRELADEFELVDAYGLDAGGRVRWQRKLIPKRHVE